MTLENKLLQKLAETTSAGERHEITISQGAWTAHLIYDRRDELSGRLWEVALHRNGATDGSVQDWAERLAKRVVGLLEPLKVVEVDAVKRQALLRSATPTAKGEDLFFYEIRLRGTANAVIHRFQGSQQPGKRREQIAFALTHESLAKLVADVTAEK
jgi:hypothetical protein